MTNQRHELDKLIHEHSIQLAALYHDTRQTQKLTGEDFQDSMDTILESYINLRRAIPKNEDGKRFGHREAYRAMSEGNFSNS